MTSSETTSVLLRRDVESPLKGTPHLVGTGEPTVESDGFEGHFRRFQKVASLIQAYPFHEFMRRYTQLADEKTRDAAWANAANLSEPLDRKRLADVIHDIGLYFSQRRFSISDRS